MYAHVNNSIYAFLFDSIINTYLITHCGLDPFSPPSSSQIGLVVSSYCDYFSPVSFPDVLDLGLRVAKLGTSSVTYEVGVFRRGEEEVKAVGGFTHVFVERDRMRPAPGGVGMEKGIRRGLERLMVNEAGGAKL